MKDIIIATKNRGKAKEFEQMFQPLGYNVQTLLDYPDIEDVKETGETFAENSKLKAETISKLLNKTVIADDSGLVVDALDGRPGVYSARYAGAQKNDNDNIVKVLQELENVPSENRTARFCCVLAVASPERQTEIFTGTCEGLIINEQRGNNGFGYDPIFYVASFEKTMAELPAEVKNTISHRANALQQLKEKISTVL